MQGRWMGLAAVLLAVFGVYAPSLSNEFAMDDRLVAKSVLDDGTPNVPVSELRPLGEYFSSHYWSAVRPTEGDLFRPATILSYALVRAACVPAHASEAREAWPQHLLNILLHLGCVALVFLLVRALTAHDAAALVAAAVFGLHAIHSEVVAAIVGRAELLGFACGLGGVLLFLSASRQSWVRAATCLAGAALLFFVAFSSKESALAWVPFLAVLELARRLGGFPSATAVREPGRAPDLAGTALCLVLATGVPLALYLGLRAEALGPLGEAPEVAYIANPLAHADTLTRLFSAVRVWGFGLLLTCAPFRLAADYGHATFAIVDTPLDAGFLAAAVALLAVLVGGLCAVRRAPLLFLAMASFLGFSFLTSNVPLAIGTIFGERLYYAPSLAVALLAAWIATVVPSRERRRVLLAGLGGVWLGMSALVILQRNPVWKDDATLFLHEADVQPGSARLQLCAATQLSDRGLKHRAIDRLRRAVEVDPDYALAWNNLAALYLDLGKLADADYCVERGLSAAHFSASHDGFRLYTNRGLIQQRLGQPAQALDAFERALEFEPTFQLARRELLNTLTNHYDAERYERALAQGERLDGIDTWAFHRAFEAHSAGRWAEAVERSRALLGRPLWPHTEDRSLMRLILGDSLIECGRFAEARDVLSAIATDSAIAEAPRRRAQGLLTKLARRQAGNTQE